MRKKNKVNIKKSIRTIPNFPKKGIMFRDITSLLKNTKAFNEVIKLITRIAKQKKITKVIGIDSRGFIFASPVAFNLNIPMLVVRKKGKLPGKTFKARYSLEYGYDILEINKNEITTNDKIMIIDDLIATGGTAIAASKLVSKMNLKSIEFVFVIELSELSGKNKLELMGHSVNSICSFKESER